jgi:hypothetical protein
MLGPRQPGHRSANELAALTRYLADGRLEIDNNLTENTIRPSAVGKKNWLFIGHPEAGWRAAAVYTLIVSCRRRGIDPWQYLRDVLQRLPSLPQSEFGDKAGQEPQPCEEEILLDGFRFISAPLYPRLRPGC